MPIVTPWKFALLSKQSRVLAPYRHVAEAAAATSAAERKITRTLQKGADDIDHARAQRTKEVEMRLIIDLGK